MTRSIDISTKEDTCLFMFKKEGICQIDLIKRNFPNIHQFPSKRECEHHFLLHQIHVWCLPLVFLLHPTDMSPIGCLVLSIYRWGSQLMIPLQLVGTFVESSGLPTDFLFLARTTGSLVLFCNSFFTLFPKLLLKIIIKIWNKKLKYRTISRRILRRNLALIPLSLPLKNTT